MRPTDRRRRGHRAPRATVAGIFVAVAVGLAALHGGPRFVAHAEDAKPALHETLRGFVPTGRYVFEPTTKGRASVVYFSARSATYVIRGEAVDAPILIRPAAGLIESFPVEAIVNRDDGGFDLRADVVTKELGRLVIDGTDMKLDVDGAHGKLGQPPPLRGWKKGADLLAFSPEQYARDAKAYKPEVGCLDVVSGCKREIRVFVYFGTWCTTCSTVMGRILAVEQALTKDEKASLHFDYYAMPSPPETWSDPEATKYDLRVLPTGLVYVDGALCGKVVGGDEWAKPEAALRALIAGR